MIIDQLFPTASDNLTDEVPVEQGTSTFKTTWQKVLNLFTSGAGTPQMDGTASTGTASSLSRSDHKHPTDTSRASQSDMTTAQGNISALQTAAANKVIYQTGIVCSAMTGDFVQLNIAGCTADHVLASVEFSIPSAIASNITWATWADGGFTINGTCTDATCTASIVLIKKDN